MALSRVKTWAAEILTFSDLNAEFNNILNNPIALISPLTANVAAGTFKITGLGAGSTAGDSVRYEQAVLQNRSTVASSATPDIFASTVGYIVDYTGGVTTTGFVAAPQAGAQRLIVPATATSFTAGANLLIAGIGSGTSLTVAANQAIYVTAVTTTQFLMQAWVFPEFGTWTPADASGAALALTIANANYIRIGRLVQVQAGITYPVTADGSTAQISGLPYAVNANNPPLTINATGGSVIVGVTSSSNFFPRLINNAGVTNATLSTVTIVVNGGYVATA